MKSEKKPESVSFVLTNDQYVSYECSGENCLACAVSFDQLHHH